jgi:hypothetical protein
LKDFGFPLEDFWKIIFLHGEIYLSFHNSSSFAVRHFFMQMARPESVTHPLVFKKIKNKK